MFLSSVVIIYFQARHMNTEAVRNTVAALGLSAAEELAYFEPRQVKELAILLKPIPRVAFIKVMSTPWFAVMWRLLVDHDKQIDGDALTQKRRELGLSDADDLHACEISQMIYLSGYLKPVSRKWYMAALAKIEVLHESLQH